MKIILFCLLGFCSNLSFASEVKWNEFSSKLDDWRQEERTEGISYIVSGSLVAVGGTIGFNSTQDPFGQLVFSLAQGLGVGAVGHGLFKLKLGHELNDIYWALEQSESLTPAQKTEVFYHYQKQWKKRQNEQQRIQAIVYGLTGLGYLYNASQVEAKPTKNLLYGLSTLSFILSARFAF